MTTQYNVFLRYNHPHTGRFGCKLGIKALKETRLGGQMDFDPKHRLDEGYNLYGIGINTERYEAFAKGGYHFDRKDTSLGMQHQVTYHKMDSYYGLTDYNANQLSYYGNLLFDSYLVNDHHTYSIGASYTYDKYDEHLNDSTFQRVEQVPGAFVEYNFADDHHWNIIAGFRADYNTYYQKMLYTPRLHVRFKTHDEFAVRLSAGKGYRSPNILAENSTMMASARQIRFLDTPKMEEAWNYGISAALKVPVGEKTLELNAEYYYTNFNHQLLVDLDTDPHAVHFTNLNGDSYSHTYQLEATYPFFKGFTLTATYRRTNVKSTYNGELREKPLTNKYKGLLTASYAPGLGKWQFDVTLQLNGGGRLPTAYTTAEGLPSWDERYKGYEQLSAQVTRFFRYWSIYAGGENITGFKQKNAIISADDPWSKDFDATMIWGPTHGAVFYIGVRLNWNKI